MVQKTHSAYSVYQHSIRSIRIALACLFLWLGACCVQAQTFTNPTFKSQDPWVCYWQGNYYYTESNGRSVLIRVASTLTGLAKAVPKSVWTAPDTGPNSQNLWAPELHMVNGSWYVYYAADDGNNANHRLFVLQCLSTNALGTYVMAKTGYPNGELWEPANCWAIDPNVFTAANGQLYVTWSGWATGATVQNIYLAALKDPLHINGSRVLIAQPTEPWETRTAPIEEGPVGYVHNGNTYITYSGSASWTTDYTVGLLTNKDGKLLNPASWSKYGPILDHHNLAYGPGSVVFTPSPDGTETWMLYHGIDSTTCNPSYSCRDLRMQKITWNQDGTPLLGYPVDPGVPLALPSGENGPFGWGASRSGDAVTGTWNYQTVSSAQSDPAGTSWHAVYRGDLLPFECAIAADLQWVANGTGDGAPKYGIYALYTDAKNHVEAFLDHAHKTFLTHALVNGKELGWQQTMLPNGFDASQFHTILVSRADHTFQFRLDGVLMQQRNFVLGNGQIGLATDGTKANYRNVRSVNNSTGWGNALGDSAEGHTDVGLRTDGWTILNSSGANGNALGAGWSQLFRGNPNLGSFTLTADLQWVATGNTSKFPKYGLYAAYVDVNNHVEVFVDRYYKVLATHGILGGSDAGWQNASLPSNFNPAQLHTLRVDKSGNTFTFSLDGTALQQRTFGILNGQVGLVTEDTKANYRNLLVIPTP